MGHVAWVTLLLRHRAPKMSPLGWDLLFSQGFLLREQGSCSSRCVFVRERLMSAKALFSAAHPAAPRARSNLVRLANAAEKRAHAVGPTRRYVARARLFLSYAPPRSAMVAEISRASRRARKRGRLDARHAKHANRRPASPPFVAWTRFVAARALENAPRPPRAPRLAARETVPEFARVFGSQTVVVFICETSDNS